MNDAQYYMRVRGRVQGPFDQEKLQSFSRRGQLSRLHEVSTDGINWARASTFPELFVGPASESTVEPPPSAPVPPSAPAPPIANPAGAASPPRSALGAAMPDAGSVPGAAMPGGGVALRRPEWWYSVHGKEQGPVEFGVLQQLTASGQLGKHDFVWKSGMAGWHEAAEISGLAFGGAIPLGSDSQLPAAGAFGETLYGTALGLRPGALLLAIAICLSAGGCCLWSLWQFFGTAVRDARAGWSLVLGALGLIESGILAAVAILLSVHAGRLAGLRHSRQPVVLEKALAALRHFWTLAAIALLLGLVLVALFLATLAAADASRAVVT